MVSFQMTHTSSTLKADYDQIWNFMQGLNFILRLAWLQTVLHSSFEHVDHRVTSLFLAALEVIRRGLWNFFRYMD